MAIFGTVPPALANPKFRILHRRFGVPFLMDPIWHRSEKGIILRDAVLYSEYRTMDTVHTTPVIQRVTHPGYNPSELTILVNSTLTA